jgi:two-component SAPR family response regulator
LYKIIILEDDSQQLSKLLGVLAKYREENPSFEYSYEAYDRGINLLTNYKQDADIIFLDIKVPDMLDMRQLMRAIISNRFL